MDGEVTLHGSWKPSFVMLFQRDKCRLEIAGTAKAKADLFECERTAKSATCKIRSVSPLSALWQASAPVAQHTILLTVTKETAKSLELTTPNGEITISASMKTKDATLTQTKRRQITCVGTYVTTEVWRTFQQDQREEDSKLASEPTTDASGTDDAGEAAPSSGHSSSSAPASSKPKGLAHGRMCGKDSECESGSCKMENRTRGRCS